MNFMRSCIGYEKQRKKALKEILSVNHEDFYFCQIISKIICLKCKNHENELILVIRFGGKRVNPIERSADLAYTLHVPLTHN